jgi:NAD(P)-dependent dehydrogenase (short-subunit alcohol dehydrogenase family)
VAALAWVLPPHAHSPRRGQRWSSLTSTSSSKHGVIGLTTSAALEYAPRGIRINAICPGTIETPMVADMITKGELDRTKAAAATPMGRIGQGEEIAGSVLWLCSPGASFVVGVALPVDGGYTAPMIKRTPSAIGRPYCTG